MALPKIAGYISRVTALLIAACATIFVAVLVTLVRKGSVTPFDVIGPGWTDKVGQAWSDRIVLALFWSLIAAVAIYAIINLTVAVFGLKSGVFRFVTFLAAGFWLAFCLWMIAAFVPETVLTVIRSLRTANSPEDVFPRSFQFALLALGLVNFIALIVEELELFSLVFKQMRQRALSTWMTMFLVVLSVGLAIAVMIVRRESQSLFGQSDFGYEAIIGPPKASATQLVFNTVYLIDVSPGNIPYKLWQEMEHSETYRPYVRWAIPFMVGDTYQGRGDRRIVGTSPEMFGYDDSGTRVPDNEESHPFEYRVGKVFELAASTDKDNNGNTIQPRMFAPRKFEAVLGSEVSAKDGFHLYDDSLTEEQNYARHAVFQATHGMPAPNEKPDIHKPKWHVVGFLKQSHTAYDRGLFVPVISLYGIEEHDIGLISQKLLQAGYDPTHIPADKAVEIFNKIGVDPYALEEATRKHFHVPPKVGPTTEPTSQPAESSGGELLKDKPEPKPADAAPEEDPDAYKLDKDGNIIPDLPEPAWEISAILIKTRGSFAASRFLYNMKVANNDALAVNPAEVMRTFFQTFFQPTTLVMLGISLLVTIVAAGSILVGIYNSVAARMREIAILRALGATKGRVLTLICVEAGLIGFFGGLGGLILGHLLGAVGSMITNARLGESINWIRIGWRVDKVEDLFGNEPLYLVLVVLIAVVAGLVPALKAYSTPVATNLSGG